MRARQQYWVFGGREFVFLSFTGIVGLAICFTLGIHLGKNAAQKTQAKDGGMPEVALAETTKDLTPSRQELAEQMKGVGKVVDDVMNRVLHDEVVRVGMKLDQTRQTELPKGTKHETSATGAGNRQIAEAEAGGAVDETEWAALTREKPLGAHTLRLLDTEMPERAKRLTDTLDSLGLKPFARAYQPPKQEKRYTVFLGGYHSLEAAKQVAARYKRQHIIEDARVVEMPSK